MIAFHKKKGNLILRLEPSSIGQSIGWVFERLLADDHIRVSKAFNFTSKDILDSDFDVNTVNKIEDIPEDIKYIDFKLGQLESGYYKVSKEILNTKFDIFFDENIDIKRKFFVAERNISIWPKLNELTPPNEIYIGGKNSEAITDDTFKKLIKK